jgi:uncharacterized lipoprotein YddW (UPF0748 family)
MSRRRALPGLLLLLLFAGSSPMRSGGIPPADVENALWYVWSRYTPAIPSHASPAFPSIGGEAQAGTYQVYLPLGMRAPSAAPEFRALWVTRFDWTRADGTWARPEMLVAIADQAAAARFNVLLFQVRGVGDAYYAPGYEPWAARLTGTVTRTLGVSPGFDPLRVLLDAAHARGLQVHAYVNVYPTWLCGVGAPPDGLNPPHPFWTFSRANGRSWSAWRVYDASGMPMNMMTCDSYLWATPAWSGVRRHLRRVVGDLVRRYDLDGVHLDLVRYPGRGYSYDPFTPSFSSSAERAEWQREQVNAMVRDLSAVVRRTRPRAWVTAAVWGVYRNRWGWSGFTEGYSDYYQDSKRWLREGWVDAIMPMIYPAGPSGNCPDTTVWTLDRFRVLVADFLADASGRYVFPGIHGGYACFRDVLDRIQAARALGARGVAIFAYGPLSRRGYWDELAAQAFPQPAPLPPLPRGSRK